MKKRNFKAMIMATTLTLSAFVGLAACGDKESSNATAPTAQDFYAMSALSSISYLSEADGDASSLVRRLAGAEAVAPATARPDGVTEEDVNAIESCLAMFDGIIAGGGIEQSIKENASTDPQFSGYKYEMSISLPAAGGSQLCAMYFNEIESKTDVDMDDGEEEIEVKTTFEGVVVYGEELFVVEGEREYEQEGLETEEEIEFRTYKNAGSEGAVEKDKNNYVVVSQSFESDEVEYEYVFFNDGRKVQELEIEYEQDRHGAEVEFQWKDVSTNVKNSTEFSIKTGNDSQFYVAFKKNGAKDFILVDKAASGYQFTYSNGFSEIVS